MKNSIHPGVFIGVIVAVVAVACFFGFRALFPSNAGGSLSTSNYTNKMHQLNQEQQNNMEKARERGPANAPPGYQEYMRHQQQGH